MNNYFDLTNEDNNLDFLTINKDGQFNCLLTDSNSHKVYFGFLLAKSPGGEKLTLCDVNFQKSETDGKYQPRLIFRRTKIDTADVSPPSNSDKVRISFAVGQEGYRNFWKMIFFLYKFKEQVDFGDFDKQFQVLTSSDLTAFLNSRDNYEKVARVAADLNIDVSTILRSSTTLKLLNDYREMLEGFINNNSSETDVQNWIDEDNHKHRQQRCMIFGLEYINFKREGSISSKKFDVLTRVGSKNIEYVLIELKSPSDDIFETEKNPTINNPTLEYKLHKELARAIPQILEYKNSLEKKSPGDAELEKLGIKGKPEVSKCIIVIGKHKNDERWKINRHNLVRSLNSSLEIWTYSELLNKLDSTIENLEVNIPAEINQT